MRSALDYKYNPSLRYSVELEREYGQDGRIGTLTVWLRSRSDALIAMLTDFFGLWSGIENRYRPGVAYSVDRDRKVVRELALSLPVDPGLSYGMLGRSLSEYVSRLNTAAGIYFGSRAPEIKRELIENECAKFYSSGNVLF